MSQNLKNIVGNIFGTYDKGVSESRYKLALLRQKLNRMYDTTENQQSAYLNQFLDNNGAVADSETSQKVKVSSKRPTPRSPITFAELDAKSATVEPIASVTIKPIEPVASETFVPTEAFKPFDTTKSNTQTNKGNTAAEVALSYVGTPYVWGGESMAEGGMDCSGYVYNVLKDLGHDVGRTTAEGYRNGGEAVNKSDLQPGDLVFYGSGSASHVGVYVGDGKVAHSSGGSKNTKSNPGKGVIVSDINHRSDYLGAKRY